MNGLCDICETLDHACIVHLRDENERLRKALAAECGKHQETLKMLAFAIDADGEESSKANPSGQLPLTRK